MKRFAAIFALLISFAISTFGQKPTVPDYRETLSKATLAVYHGNQRCEDASVDTWLGPMKEWGCKFQRRFVCTATVIGRLSESTYVGLTAGHCFNWAQKDEYFVADKIGVKPVLHHINITKFENDERYDYGVFTFDSLRDYPVIDIDHESLKSPTTGTLIINVNYSYGLVKQTLEGKVVSEQITDPAVNADAVKGRYFVSIGLGPGASGSAVVDSESHKIVGIVEAIFPSTQMATLVMPTGDLFQNFIEDDSAGIKPEDGPKPTSPSAKAPSKSYWQQFIDYLNGIL